MSFNLSNEFFFLFFLFSIIFSFSIVRISKKIFKGQLLDKDFSRNTFFQKFPNARTFPQIIINKQHIGGYEELKRWLEQNYIDENF